MCTLMPKNPIAKPLICIETHPQDKNMGWKNALNRDIMGYG